MQVCRLIKNVFRASIESSLNTPETSLSLPQGMVNSSCTCTSSSECWLLFILRERDSWKLEQLGKSMELIGVCIELIWVFSFPLIILYGIYLWDLYCMGSMCYLKLQLWDPLPPLAPFWPSLSISSPVLSFPGASPASHSSFCFCHLKLVYSIYLVACPLPQFPVCWPVPSCLSRSRSYLHASGESPIWIWEDLT